MNDKTLSILLNEDCFSELTLRYFDLMENKSLDRTMSLSSGGMLSTREKAVRYLIEKLKEENYVLYKPFSSNIEEDILAEKDGVFYLFVFVLDSESERKLWPLDRIKDDYKIYIVRDRALSEKKGLNALTLDEAFDSFNFLNR